MLIFVQDKDTLEFLLYFNFLEVYPRQWQQDWGRRSESREVQKEWEFIELGIALEGPPGVKLGKQTQSGFPVVGKGYIMHTLNPNRGDNHKNKSV